MKVLTRSVVLLMAAFAAAPASAQTRRPERPYRGLFGGGVSQTEQVLTASLSLGGGYDGNVLAGGETITPGREAGRRPSKFGNASAGLSYSLNRSRVGMEASASAATAYYPVLARPFVPQYSLGVSATAKLSSRTTLAAGQSFGYQPTYTLAGFAPLFQADPNLSPVVNGDLGAQIENHRTNTGGVSLTQQLTNRVAASGSYSYQRSGSASNSYDFSSWTGGAGLQVGLAAGLGLKLGYHRTESRQGRAGSPPFSRDTIDIGLDFTRALSLTRRTKLSFGSGVASVADERQTEYRLIGQGTLSRELGRSWDTAVTYQRSVMFLDAFLAPAFSDGVTAGVGGLLIRQLELKTSIGTSRGNIGFTRADNGFTSHFGSVGLTVGATRHVGFGVDYTYYRYLFGEGVVLPPGYLRQSDRQSVRAYLRVWGPLFLRARRSNASR